jgi:hypothetical protein
MNRGQIFSLAVPLGAFCLSGYIASVANGIYGTVIAVSALVVGV